MANLNNLRLFRNIHMRGIGGTSMSGIAEMLKHWGFHVTGSDDNQSELTDKLIEKGIPVTIGHDFDNVSKASLVVYTAAIKDDDIQKAYDFLAIHVKKQLSCLPFH